MTRRLPKMAEIGRCLRLARERANKTQEQAAAVCRNKSGKPMQRNAIAEWESGESLPQALNLLRLASFYNESPLVLLGQATRPRAELAAGSPRAEEIARLAERIYQLAMGFTDPEKPTDSTPPETSEGAGG